MCVCPAELIPDETHTHTHTHATSSRLVFCESASFPPLLSDDAHRPQTHQSSCRTSEGPSEVKVAESRSVSDRDIKRRTERADVPRDVQSGFTRLTDATLTRRRSIRASEICSIHMSEEEGVGRRYRGSVSDCRMKGCNPAGRGTPQRHIHLQDQARVSTFICPGGPFHSNC